jgi:hypothetical protein
MTDPPTERGDPPGAGSPHAVPGERAPRRALETAPSERLATARAAAAGVSPAARAAAPGGAAAGDAAGSGSRGRAVVLGVVAAAGGALVHLGAATVLLWTAGLLVVALVMGFVVGWAVALGAGSSAGTGARRGISITLALASIVLAGSLNWAISGLFLGPLEYLAQVYGLLVPLQILLAGVGALAGSR